MQSTKKGSAASFVRTLRGRRRRGTSSSNSRLSNPYQRTPKAATKAAAVAATSTTNNYVVCSISENLANETCVATMKPLTSPTYLQVVKQVNGQTYAETLAYLDVLQPNEILVNEGRLQSQLISKLRHLYNSSFTSTTSGGLADITATTATNTKRRKLNTTTPQPQEPTTIVKCLPRTYFDQTRGAELLRRITRSGSCSRIAEEYIVLSACHALLKYVQYCLTMEYTNESLQLELLWGGTGKLQMDRSTLMHLELLSNAKTGKRSLSLLGTMDCTKTSVGSRLLRTNLMAPPTQVATISARLDLVTVFLQNEEFFCNVEEQLLRLPELEKMLSHMAVTDTSGGPRTKKKTVTAAMASRGISALVCLKSTLSVIPNFCTLLQTQWNQLTKHSTTTDNNDDEESVATGLDSSSLLLGLGGASTSTIAPQHVAGTHQLLQAVILTMKQTALKDILELVLGIFTSSTTHLKNTHAMRHQECFALKPGTDGMMDVLRKAFLANVDDIYKLADSYSDTLDCTVLVKETTSRGYYLSIPTASMEATTLPNTFIQVVKTGRFINCTTEEVHSLNARAQENVQDLLVMTHERIQQVTSTIRTKYDALASLADAIALMDMCHCFADTVASSTDTWCRPIVTDCS